MVDCVWWRLWIRTALTSSVFKWRIRGLQTLKRNTCVFKSMFSFCVCQTILSLHSSIYLCVTSVFSLNFQFCFASVFEEACNDLEFLLMPDLGVSLCFDLCLLTWEFAFSKPLDWNLWRHLSQNAAFPKNHSAQLLTQSPELLKLTPENWRKRCFPV